jgi:hypothetical protein
MLVFIKIFLLNKNEKELVKCYLFSVYYYVHLFPRFSTFLGPLANFT